MNEIKMFRTRPLRVEGLEKGSQYKVPSGIPFIPIYRWYTVQTRPAKFTAFKQISSEKSIIPLIQELMPVLAVLSSYTVRNRRCSLNLERRVERGWGCSTLKGGGYGRGRGQLGGQQICKGMHILSKGRSTLLQGVEGFIHPLQELQDIANFRTLN